MIVNGSDTPDASHRPPVLIRQLVLRSKCNHSPYCRIANGGRPNDAEWWQQAHSRSGEDGVTTVMITPRRFTAADARGGDLPCVVGWDPPDLNDSTSIRSSYAGKFMTYQNQEPRGPMPLELSPPQRAVLDSLRRRDSDRYRLSQWYLGALYAVNNPYNPDRFSQAAQSLRELLEKLPRAVGKQSARGQPTQSPR